MNSLFRYRNHFIPSLTGWCFFALSYPGKAIALINKRAAYALNHKMVGTWTDPSGYVVDTPQKLVSYWTIFIEKELHHASWISAIASAPSPCIIDVGANAGVFVHFIHTLNRNAEIVAVEPQEYLVKTTLSRYAEATKANLRIVQAACSDHVGMASLHLSCDGEGTASLSAEFGAHTRTVSVPLVTIDQIAPSGEIHLLKIDAEGHDLKVLVGAKETIGRIRFVIAELHPGDSVDAFREILGEDWDSVRLSLTDYLFIHQRGKTLNGRC